TPADITGLERVYGQFGSQGTRVGYSVSDPELMGTINRRAGRVPLTSPPIATPLTPLVIEAGGTSSTTGALIGPQVPAQAPPSFPNYADLMTATDGAGTNWSYLASDKNYESVREMQRQNRIVPLVGDFAGPKALKAVGEYL